MQPPQYPPLKGRLQAVYQVFQGYPGGSPVSEMRPRCLAGEPNTSPLDHSPPNPPDIGIPFHGDERPTIA
ncbi:hypothetical protein CesoFtcFv8_006689 [Champsocephalus esox]|uniref:Uncharacterized protein n=1 Tax=Champsocephalus esox TaxID=159716 RepID=A0AAN8CPK9_9TELE|nr:hypothetical protein CesoFtcFv8_006689 [Champsocephalus esox]